MATVTSKLERNTQATTTEEWDQRRPRLEGAVKPLLEKQPGFESLKLEWSQGRLTETTQWSSEQACRDYIRNGGAATVATFADQVMPTAAYPNGTWVRTNSF